MQAFSTKIKEPGRFRDAEMMKNIKMPGWMIVGAVVGFLLLGAGGCGGVIPSGGGPATLTLAIQFPARQMALYGFYPLISPSTSEIRVNVHAGSLSGAILGSTVITSPPAGGSASETVTISGYSGSAAVEIVGFNTASATPTSLMSVDTNIIPGTASTIDTPLVEFFQGASITAVPQPEVIGPDGVRYLVNAVFLDNQFGKYVMGVNITNVASGTTEFHYSSENLDQTLISATHIVNGKIRIPLDVPENPPPPTARRWNRYDTLIDFMPGGLPTNAPTISAIFMGTFAHDAAGAVVASTGANPGPPGTVVPIETGAIWTNNVAPRTSNIPVVIF